jgi:hypothetical protein
MKKLLALAGIALIAAACTNNDEPVQECGQINLTLENSTAPEIEVSTRTVTDLTETVHFRLGFLLSMLKNAASYILLHLPLLSKVMIREGSASVETSTV